MKTKKPTQVFYSLVTQLIAFDELFTLGDGFLEFWNGGFDKRFLIKKRSKLEIM